MCRFLLQLVPGFAGFRRFKLMEMNVITAVFQVPPILVGTNRKTKGQTELTKASIIPR